MESVDAYRFAQTPVEVVALRYIAPIAQAVVKIAVDCLRGHSSDKCCGKYF